MKLSKDQKIDMSMYKITNKEMSKLLFVIFNKAGTAMPIIPNNNFFNSRLVDEKFNVAE